MDVPEPPPTSDDRSEWDRLSPADQQGMLLATEARTLGSQGQKHGNDVGAVLVVPSDGAENGNAWRVLSWGCARTLTRAGGLDEDARDETAEDVPSETELPSGSGAAKKRKKKKPAGAHRIDVHAEMDAVAFASKKVAAGIKKIVYSDAIRRHASEEGADRQLVVASANGVQITENAPSVPRHLAPYSSWLQGKETRLFSRPEVFHSTRKEPSVVERTD